MANNPVRYAKYSQEDELAVFISYRLEGNNAAAASRVTGVPAITIRSWVKRWKDEGFTPGEDAWVEETIHGFTGKATKIRDMALSQLEKKIPEAKNIGQLMVVVDKLNNHIRVAQGQATSITEHKINEHEVSDALKNYLENAAQATIERHEIVIDADFEEQVLGIPENTPDEKE